MSSGSEAPSNRRYPRITRSPGSSVSFVSMTRRRRPTIEKRATNPLPTNSSIASASVAGSIPTIALILRKTDVSGRKDALRCGDGGGERDRVVQDILAGRPHGVRRVRFGRSGWHCRHGHHAVGSGDVCGYGMATPTTSATRVFIGPPSLLECATVGNDAASSLFDEENGREVVGRQRLASSGSSGPARSAVRAWHQRGPPLADERGHARDWRHEAGTGTHVSGQLCTFG